MVSGLVSCTAGLALLGAANAALYDQVIQTPNGPVQGYPAFNSSPVNMSFTNWADIAVWKGIPFAANTSGANRFRPPQPVTVWNSTLDTAEWGDVCPSTGSGDGYVISENCLNVNVWSAANSTDAKLPVVMWSYPAGGTGRDNQFNGAGNAAAGVVHVTYNYRAGSFGWLAHPELSEENLASFGTNSSGNWGMLDQYAAVEWIRQNIASFGGDPDHITVMGQSAGSAATYHILNSNMTAGKFVGAIIQSGVRYPRDPECTSLAENYLNLSTALETGVSYASYLNVSSIAEMRALPMADLETSIMSGGDYDFTATLDGYALPATYEETLVKSLANDVPILTGNTRDESGATYGLDITLDTYYSDLNATYAGDWVQRFLAAYPANDSATASVSENLQWSERSTVGTNLWSGLWAANYESKIWNYFWDHAPPGTNSGAAHESEITYAMNNLYDTDDPWQAEDYAIARTLNAYWVNFIKTGDPNGDGLAYWPSYQANSSIVQEVGEGFQPIPIAGDPARVELFKEWFATLQAY